MKRLFVLAVLLALVPAAAATTTRERPTAGPISTMSLTGAVIAYANAFKPGCHEIRVWGHDSRSDRRLASHCFAGTSTGSGVAGVVEYGGRALWLTYTGGNIREWSLWTKNRGVKARRIALLTADVDGPPPLVLGRPWEGSLPYATGRKIVVLEFDGSRRFTLTASDAVVALSAHSRGYAAVLDNGTVLAISPEGKQLREYRFAAGFVQEAVLAGPGLIAKTIDGLEIHAGGPVRKIRLPRGARFFGLAEGVVAYGVGRDLRLLWFMSGRDQLFRTLAPGFQAQLGRRGLAYGSERTLGFAGWLHLPG